MTAETRPAGRPRDASRDELILDAALELVAEEGFSGLSMEGIAHRAGVGKATIYRRWESKTELVFDAWERCVPEAGEPMSGSLRDDLVTSYRRLAADLSREPLRSVLPHVLARSSIDGDFEERIRAFIASRRVNTIDRLERAIAEGDLGEVDVDRLADRLTGPIFYRLMVRRLPVDDDYVAGVIDEVVGPHLI